MRLAEHRLVERESRYDALQSAVLVASCLTSRRSSTSRPAYCFFNRQELVSVILRFRQMTTGAALRKGKRPGHVVVGVDGEFTVSSR